MLLTPTSPLHTSYCLPLSFSPPFLSCSDLYPLLALVVCVLCLSTSATLAAFFFLSPSIPSLPAVCRSVVRVTVDVQCALTVSL